jgi:RNA polymerase sigma-70 factor, ECF subfamily
MANWQEILSQEGAVIWQTAYRILCHRADTEECFQETFLAALEVSRCEVVRSWRALLQRLATARAVDRLRQRRRRRDREEVPDWDTVQSAMPSPSQTAEERELAQRLREALVQIPPKQAEVFCLHCLEGWSYQEIAQQLGLSVDAVGVVLYRARKRLQRLLASISPESPKPAEPGEGGSRKEIL